MANLNLKFLRGLQSALPTAGTDGYFYLTTDTHRLFTSIDGNVVPVNEGVVTVANLDALASVAGANAGEFFYCTQENILCVFNGQTFVQINPDTGVTSVEVVGDGNAVTDASYDAATRKLTLNKGETFALPSDISNAVGELGNDADGNAYANVKAYVDAKTTGIATEATVANKVDKEEGKSLIADTEIARLAGMSDGANKVEASETNGSIKIDGVETVVYTHPEKHAISDVDGLQDAIDALAKTHSDDKTELTNAINGKVASVTAGDGSITVGGTANAPTVAAKISADADNALTLADDGLKVVIPTAAEYSIVKAADSGDYAAIYNLTKDGTIVGASINIPKDIVVKSGSVVNDEIILVLNDEAATEIKIPVGSLIEYVTSGSATGDMIVVNISDDHKVTATITDGTVTLAKLDTDTQTKINKAHIHENAGVLDGITADKVEAWDAAEQNTKDYADGLDEAMDARVQSLEAIDHEAYKAADTELATAIKTDVANQDAVVLAEAQKYTDTAKAEAIADAEGKVNTLAGNVYTKEQTYTQDEVDSAIETAVTNAYSWGEF